MDVGDPVYSDYVWIFGEITGDVQPLHVLMVDSHRYATCQADMRLPDLPELLPHKELVLIPHFSLQAILVLDSPDVDLRLWNDTVAEMEASGTSAHCEFPHGPRTGLMSCHF